MGRRLKDSITSDYLSAANRLNSKQARHRIVAYVESYDDVFFWRTVLSSFETDRYYFQVMLPSRSRQLNRGKKAALMRLMTDRVGSDMIACVDADYDYLIQKATPTSQQIIDSPYVFHTYAYAIENLQCYAPSLHDVCVAVTLNDHHIFDFNGYLRSFSEIIYPLFVWNVWFYRTPHYGEFTMSDFLSIIEMGNFSIVHAQDMLARLSHKVARRLDALRRNYPEGVKAYPKVEASLRSLGVTPQTTYLYIQGHHLFDRVVSPAMTRICAQLIRERENEISRDSMHSTQRRNELSCYSHSVEDVEAMLKKNMGYVLSDVFAHIRADVQHFLDTYHAPAPAGTVGATAGPAALAPDPTPPATAAGE